jgi:hypothetical protein
MVIAAIMGKDEKEGGTMAMSTIKMGMKRNGPILWACQNTVLDRVRGADGTTRLIARG